jgi:hypothetical protein
MTTVKSFRVLALLCLGFLGQHDKKIGLFHFVAELPKEAKANNAAF